MQRTITRLKMCLKTETTPLTLCKAKNALKQKGCYSGVFSHDGDAFFIFSFLREFNGTVVPRSCCLSTKTEKRMGVPSRSMYLCISSPLPDRLQLLPTRACQSIICCASERASGTVTSPAEGVLPIQGNHRRCPIRTFTIVRPLLVLNQLFIRLHVAHG